MRRTNRRAGLTLVELMVALAILGIVTSLAFGVFGAQRRSYSGIKNAIEVQEDVRLVTEAILSDIRMAGYMVPQQTGITSIDGGANEADTICISDPEKIADTAAADAKARFDGAEITLQIDADGSSATLALGDVDVDGDGDADFVGGEGVIIVDDTSSHCGLITGISGAANNVIAFTPDTPTGFDASPASARVVPAVIYFLDGTDLRRNSLRVASRVEDLQIEFGIDGDGDGLIADDEYEDDLNGEDPLEMLGVRLSVIARADSEEESVDSWSRPASANRGAGGGDGFRRRQATAIAMPRNLQ